MPDAPRVLLHTDDPDTARQVLARRHPDIEPAVCTSFDGLAEAIAGHRAEAVYSTRFDPGPFPRAALIGVADVRWVHVGGSGCNHLAPWDPAAVTVTNSAGVAADAMAGFALGAMLHFAMDVPGIVADQRAHRWRMRSIAPLDGRTLVVVGLGKTGQRMAEIAAALKMRVIGIRARPRPTPGCERVLAPADLPDALAEADFVMVAVPLSDATRGLISAAALQRIKPGAVLVDLSRGGIVETDALLAALDDARLKAAALDVFETEPLPADSPLWDRPDILISPHCSATYDGWEEKALTLFAENLARWRAGQPLENVVDPVRGY